jgi:hypothetical protein
MAFSEATIKYFFFKTALQNTKAGVNIKRFAFFTEKCAGRA